MKLNPDAADGSASTDQIDLEMVPARRVQIFNESEVSEQTTLISIVTNTTMN